MARAIQDIFPAELLEHLLSLCDPLEVAAFAQTSRFFRSIIYATSDQHLWRSLYLQQDYLDDPRSCVSFLGKRRPAIDWKSELQCIIRAKSVLDNPALCRPGEQYTILRTLLDVSSYVPPSPHVFSDQLSLNLLWVAAVLRGGKFLHDDEWMPSAEGQQLRARLHAQFGLTPEDTKASRRVDSRAFVYDMRRYDWQNHFGPFLPDGSGRVNWVHVQAIHHVVSMHVVDVREEEDFIFTIFPMSMPFCQPIIPEGIDLDQEEDWAGIEGMWTCAYCFCDHRELLIYNDFNTTDAEPDKTIFEDPDFDEVFRSLPDVHFRVTSTEHDPAFPTRPKINFAGDMSGQFTMRGYVKLTPDEQIRWHFTSGDQGQEVWSSEGVQVGGVRSPFGVLGTWTTTFHDVHDPVGPFWLRRAHGSPNLK